MLFNLSTCNTLQSFDYVLKKCSYKMIMHFYSLDLSLNQLDCSFNDVLKRSLKFSYVLYTKENSYIKYF